MVKELSPEDEVSGCLRGLHAKHLLPQCFQGTAVDVDRTPGSGCICTLRLWSLTPTVSLEVLTEGWAQLSWILGTIASWGDTEDGDLGLCGLDSSSSQIFEAGGPTPFPKLRLCLLLRGSL